MQVTKLKPVDAVVVGIGVAGSILCKELAAAGLKVVGLERGRLIDPDHDFALPYAHDELKYESSQHILQNLALETITIRNAITETALPMRELGTFRLGECEGGSGALGVRDLSFSPWDFETRSRAVERYGKTQIPEDCTSQDWSVTYDELEPYFNKF